MLIAEDCPPELQLKPTQRPTIENWPPLIIKTLTHTSMAPGHFARRGGKVFSSQRSHPSPSSQRKSGLGLGKGIAHRRRIVAPKDTVLGITKGDIRRLARRGGVKRISIGVYDTARAYLKDFLRDVLPILFSRLFMLGPA